MDRIRCYERRDGGSIPSRGANNGVVSVVVAQLSVKQLERVRFPTSPQKIYSELGERLMPLVC
jgi:hypothetical protein